jgi:large-conductance mechanosensitive channel
MAREAITRELSTLIGIPTAFIMIQFVVFAIVRRCRDSRQDKEQKSRSSPSNGLIQFANNSPKSAISSGVHHEAGGL